MHWSLLLSLWFLVSPAQGYSLDEITERYTRRTTHGIHLPIIKRKTNNSIERRASFSVAGLGDYLDVYV